jgi:hypothetical protein
VTEVCRDEPAISGGLGPRITAAALTEGGSVPGLVYVRLVLHQELCWFSLAGKGIGCSVLPPQRPR